MNQFATPFIAMANDYLEGCNHIDRSQVSSILDTFLLVNDRLPHHLLMATKHDLSTKSTLSTGTATEFVNITKGNLENVATKTTDHISLGDQIELLSQPASYSSTAQNLKNTSTSKQIATTLRNKVLELSKLVVYLTIDSFSNRTTIDRMRYDMPDVSFYLSDASDYLLSIGASEPSGDDSRNNTSTLADQTVEQIKSLLQNHMSAQWRGGSRNRGIAVVAVDTKITKVTFIRVTTMTQVLTKAVINTITHILEKLKTFHLLIHHIILTATTAQHLVIPLDQLIALIHILK